MNVAHVLYLLELFIVRSKKCSNYKKESVITTKCRRTILYHQYQEVAHKSLLSAIDTSKVISIISTLVPQYKTVLQHAQ